jgi:hypothetical protein
MSSSALCNRAIQLDRVSAYNDVGLQKQITFNFDISKMKLLAYLFIILTSLLVSGCQSTGVIPMDQDSYMIGKKDGTPGLGVSLTNKAEVYREANDFCRAKGLEVQTMEAITTPARLAQLGSTELHFKCVAPGGIAKPLQKTPDTVIEVRK